MHATSKIVLPLDVDSSDQAIALAYALRDEVAAFKVGLELVNSVGVDIFDRLIEELGPDVRIFYDCKLHDIPNTVAGASRAITRRGLWMFNVHASGGSAMMSAAVDAVVAGSVRRSGFELGQAPRPLVIAVTVLTSISQDVLSDELGIDRPIGEYAVGLARLAQQAGCDGVVCSPHEIAAIREACGSEFVIVTPGVRPAGSDHGDQRRVLSPGQAAASGADYLVIGRPISAAPDPVAAARTVNAETLAAYV